MDRHLFLVRHAQAVSGGPGQRDFDRELTSSGILEACKMGGRLKQKGVLPGIVYASTALRALTTAQLMAEQLGYDPDAIVAEPGLYEEFTMQSFVEMIARLPETQTSAMVVGHNPKQTYLAEYLTQSEIGAIPTGGVVHIVFENQPWAEVTGGGGRLEWIEYPAH